MKKTKKKTKGYSNEVSIIRAKLWDAIEEWRTFYGGNDEFEYRAEQKINILINELIQQVHKDLHPNKNVKWKH